MQREELRDRIEARMFQPFRIFVTDGAQYAVYRPHQATLSSRTLALAVLSDPQQEYGDRIALIDVAHITRIEPIVTPAEPSPN